MILTGFNTYLAKILATFIHYIWRWRFTFIFGVVYSLYINMAREKVEHRIVSTEDQQPALKVPGPESLCPKYQEGNIKTITYIESTGHECLTPRQACGIETAARANPKMKVMLYVNNIRVGPYDPEPGILRHGRVRSCTFNRILSLTYGNLNIVKSNFLDNIRDTDFGELVESRKLLRSRWSDVQIGEIMRLILLNQTGGIYLDFNNIVFRPIHCLRNTFSYYKDAPNIANAIMATDIGHPFLKYLAKLLVRNYDPDIPINISPSVLAEAFKSFCKQENLAAGTFTCLNSSSLTLIDAEVFFPIKESEHQYFYLINHEGLDQSPLKSAFSTHVYLSNAGTQVHENSLYARLARQYCPTVWKTVSEINIPLGF